MFSSLSQNSIIYILDIKDTPKLNTGTVISVSMPRPKNATFGMNMETIIDITATVDGERREFKGVPSMNTIANFGSDAFILADSKDSLNSYISTALYNSKNIINSVDRHKALIKGYEDILQEINPVLKADKEKDKAIQSLQDQVNTLQESMKQMLDLMTNKKTQKT